MTAEHLLAVLYNHDGVGFSVSEGRLRVEAPRGVLTKPIREALGLLKSDVLRLLSVVEEYRSLLGSEAVSLDAQARLIDELGPALATAVRDAVERQHQPDSSPVRDHDGLPKASRRHPPKTR